MQKSILVIFGQNPPRKSRKWLRQFDKILGPKEAASLTSPGSVQEAYKMVNELAILKTHDGSRLSKLINYQGYELWWMDYDTMYYQFCMPYTRYRNLLSFLKDFEKIYLFEPDFPDLFRYYLEAHRRQCFVLKQFKAGKFPFPFGVFLQIFLSVLFLPLLIITRPQLMVWMGDKLAPSRDYDFRAKFIYEELRKRKISFVEFIRSLEKWPVVLQHAWKRKRPVFYSAAFISFIQFLAGLSKRNNNLISFGKFADSEQHFRFLVAAHYLNNAGGTILAIRVISFILKLIGVKAANISAGMGRSFHELLACKLNSIMTVGIEHGINSKYYFVSDFMPGFDGKIPLSVDRYGLWSEGRRNYYLQNSNAYRPEQLFVSGPMRPLIAKIDGILGQSMGKLKVLYISEEVAAPEEALPYILTLLESKDFELCFKFRPYCDEFELWLKGNRPEIYDKILGTTKVFRGTMEEAVGQCDITVGSYSTAVLEALLQLKPFIYYRTNKWGDYFGIKAAGLNDFFAENPRELLERIKHSPKIKKEELKKLQAQFFGNPRQNGSAWVVEQVSEFLKK